jgi:hypothetical protein
MNHLMAKLLQDLIMESALSVVFKLGSRTGLEQLTFSFLQSFKAVQFLHLVL